MDGSKARILYIHHVPLIGGAEVGLFDLVRLLDTRRFEPAVVLPSRGPLSQRFEDLGVPVEIVPLLRFKRSRNPLTLLRYAFSLLFCVPRLARCIRRQRADIVHSNASTAHIYGGWAAWRAGVPCVWHCRDLVRLGRLGKALYQRADRIIAISSAVAASLGPCRSGPDKVTVILNGVDTVKFRPGDEAARQIGREKWGIGPDRFVVGMVAQFAPWKAHGLFLEAAARVAVRCPKAFFVVVGEDLFGDHADYKTGLKVAAERLGLRDRLLFTGYEPDMALAIQAMDLLVHPAAREPFGRALVEAMSAGKPVIAADDAGPREIIENGVSGLLVPPGDEEAIAAAVEQVMADSGLAARLGQAARMRVERQFDARECAARIQELYDDLRVVRTLQDMP